MTYWDALHGFAFYDPTDLVGLFWQWFARCVVAIAVAALVIGAINLWRDK